MQLELDLNNGLFYLLGVLKEYIRKRQVNGSQSITENKQTYKQEKPKNRDRTTRVQTHTLKQEVTAFLKRILECSFTPQDPGSVALRTEVANISIIEKYANL